MQKKNLPEWIPKTHKSYTGLIHRSCTKYKIPKKIREKLISRFLNNPNFFYSFDGQELKNPDLLCIKELNYLKKKQYFNYLREKKKYYK